MSDDRANDALTAILSIATRLRDTAAAVAERANEAAGGPTDGEAGEQSPRDAWASADFGALIAAFAQLRESVPPDVRQRLSDSIDDVLVSTRSLIDWYLERDRGDQGPP